MPDNFTSPNMNMGSAGMPEEKKNAVRGVVVAVIVIIILALAAWLIFGSSGTSDQTGNQPSGLTNQTNQSATEQPTTAPVPNEVFSYVGEVTAVGNGQITVLAKKENNLLEEDTTLTIKADANTQVIKRNIPKILPESGSGSGLFSQENIALSDIKVGDQVTVVSPTNVRGVTSFTASRIEVLDIK